MKVGRQTATVSASRGRNDIGRHACPSVLAGPWAAVAASGGTKLINISLLPVLLMLPRLCWAGWAMSSVGASSAGESSIGSKKVKSRRIEVVGVSDRREREQEARMEGYGFF